MFESGDCVLLLLFLQYIIMLKLDKDNDNHSVERQLDNKIVTIIVDMLLVFG